MIVLLRDGGGGECLLSMKASASSPCSAVVSFALISVNFALISSIPIGYIFYFLVYRG